MRGTIISPTPAPALPYDASAADVKSALVFIDSDFEECTVIRTDGPVAGTYYWEVSFPFFLGDIPPLLVNSAGLQGKNAAAFFSTINDGKVAEVQRISTAGSSTITGSFALTLENYTTEQIPYDASAEEMESILEKLPNIGDVLVTRVSTGLLDFNTWGGQEQTVDIHLNYVRSVFQHEIGTYAWMITFVSRSGEIPLFCVCCDEIATDQYDNVTLFSAFSRDSELIVTQLVAATTERLNGNISLALRSSFGYDPRLREVVSSARNAAQNQLRYNEIQTKYFAFDAPASRVAAALEFMGYEGVFVEEFPVDENFHRSWEIYMNGTMTPILDTMLTPDLIVEYSQIFPKYSRDLVKFSWESTIPTHEVQGLNSSVTVAQTCLVETSSGTSSVIIPADSSVESINAAFAEHLNELGEVIVMLNSSSNEWLVLFVELAENIPLMSCSDSHVIEYQNSTITALSGNFSLHVTMSDGQQFLQLNYPSMRLLSTFRMRLMAPLVVIKLT
jgi:hypothetical protein